MLLALKAHPANPPKAVDEVTVTVTRVPEGTTVTPAVAGTTLSFDGVEIDVNGMAPSAGDSWLIQPTRDAASAMPGHGQRLLLPKTDEKRVAPCDGAAGGRGGGEGGVGDGGGSRVTAGARS